MSSNNNNNNSRKRSRWDRASQEQAATTQDAGGKITDQEALTELLASAAAQTDNKRNHARKNTNSRTERKDSPKNDSSYYSNPSHKTNRSYDDSSSKRSRITEAPTAEQEPEEEEKKEKIKPNFGLSGALARDETKGNMYKGALLKFKEPPDARAPNTQWRLYVFKDDKNIETLHISKQSAYLVGRNTDICDIPVAHASCSSQHAVIQYRAVPVKGDNTVGAAPRLHCQPYLLDLESTNGTFINGTQVEAARYYQLKKGDVIKFGASTREYVLLTQNTTSVS